MRAIVVDRFGGPEVMSLREVAAPTPGPGELEVELRSIGVNFADTERRRGIFGVTELPWIPGREGAGIVRAVGAGVDPSWLGRAVAYWTPRASGSYAERAVVPASEVFVFEAAVPFETMAALPLQGLTAWALVNLATDVRPGHTVLVHAAAGGVGLLLVQLAVQAGARVLGTVSTHAKAAVVRDAGGEPLLYDDDEGASLTARVRDATAGRGVHRVFDSVGQATADASLAMLAPFGHLVFFGDASGPVAPVAVDALYGRSLRVSAFLLRFEDAPSVWADAREALAAAVVRGQLKMHVGSVFPLALAADAHRALEGRRTTGKVLLAP